MGKPSTAAARFLLLPVRTNPERGSESARFHFSLPGSWRRATCTAHTAQPTWEGCCLLLSPT